MISSIVVYDLKGKILMNFENQVNFVEGINIDKLANGSYVVQVNTIDGQHSSLIQLNR